MRSKAKLDRMTPQQISEIFRRLDDVRYYMLNNRSFMEEVMDEGQILAELDSISSDLENRFYPNVADGTTRSHPIEDE